MSLFNDFKEYRKRIMVATDIFGRGIDIIRVNTVINYDMPDSPDSYMHRVGRAGRFGGKGLTITFVSEKEDEEIFDQIQKRFQDLRQPHSQQGHREADQRPMERRPLLRGQLVSQEDRQERPQEHGGRGKAFRICPLPFERGA